MLYIFAHVSSALTAEWNPSQTEQEDALIDVWPRWMPDKGLGTKYWSFLSWVWDWVGVVSGCTTGLFLGNELWPSFLCNFVTTNKSSDSVTETIPQCNSTSHRPTLMVDLKMARFGQCPLFHLPVFKILVKGLGPFCFLGGPFCVSSSGPFRALGPFL